MKKSKKKKKLRTTTIRCVCVCFFLCVLRIVGWVALLGFAYYSRQVKSVRNIRTYPAREGELGRFVAQLLLMMLMLMMVVLCPLYDAGGAVRSRHDSAVALHVEVLLVRQNRVATEVEHLW